MATLQRKYAEERLISADPWLPKMTVRLGALLAVFVTLALDVMNRHDNVYYLRTMLAFIVGGALVLSLQRYLRNFIDDVRAGPDYFVIRRDDCSVIVPMDDIMDVHFDVFLVNRRYLFLTRRGFLERFRIRLVRPTARVAAFSFCPQSDWRDEWPKRPLTRRLADEGPQW